MKFGPAGWPPSVDLITFRRSGAWRVSPVQSSEKTLGSQSAETRCWLQAKTGLFQPLATRRSRRHPGEFAPMAPNVRKWFDLPRMMHNDQPRMPLILVNGLAEQSESWF